MIVTNISYTYDANGMRASKTVNGVKSTFEYVGGKLVYEKRGNMDIYYQYDSNGNLSAIRYVDGTEDNIYYTVCNSRGDVEAIYGGGGGLKARYIYDTWGNTVKIVDVNGNEITDKNTVGYINPIRYRGYYYDAETGFYYLQSRYYDPETGRFLNADGYVSTGSGVLDTNMFAYCGNNPVNMSDHFGYAPKWLKDVVNYWKGVFKSIDSGSKKVRKAIGGSFHFEFGCGFGLGASTSLGPVKVNVGAYQDGLTMGIKKGDSYHAIKGSVGVGAKVSKYSLGITSDYEHRFSTNSVTDWDDHCALSTPGTVYNCPKTNKSPLQLSVPFIKPAEGEMSDELFIGVSGDAHCIIGGHFAIGWDVDEFIKIMKE